MQKYHVLAGDYSMVPPVGDHHEFYDASDVDARITQMEHELNIRKAAIEAQFRLIKRVEELEEQVATLERSNKRLRQKLDRAIS